MGEAQVERCAKLKSIYKKTENLQFEMTKEENKYSGEIKRMVK